MSTLTKRFFIEDSQPAGALLSVNISGYRRWRLMLLAGDLTTVLPSTAILQFWMNAQINMASCPVPFLQAAGQKLPYTWGIGMASRGTEQVNAGLGSGNASAYSAQVGSLPTIWWDTDAQIRLSTVNATDVWANVFYFVEYVQ